MNIFQGIVWDTSCLVWIGDFLMIYPEIWKKWTPEWNQSTLNDIKNDNKRLYILNWRQGSFKHSKNWDSLGEKHLFTPNDWIRNQRFDANILQRNSGSFPEKYWNEIGILKCFCEKNISIVLTFFPSKSCVPWAKTLSTLAGSLNVTNPKPLK